MELREYLQVLRKGWALVLAFVIAGLAVGVFIAATTTKIYQANVQIFVATSAGATPAELQAGNSFTSDRVQSYTSIANSPDVVGPVVQRLDLKITPRELAGQISADAPQNKVLINLHVVDTNPQDAARIANAVATQFNTVVQDTEQSDSSTGKPVVKLTVIHPAVVPGVPIKPKRDIDVGLGFVLGLLLGLGIVVLRDVLDNTVKGPADLESLGVPVLGVVPLDKRTSKMPVAFRGDPHSARSEAYRQLRTNMQFVDVDNPPRVIAVTSAISGEGKSITAINLAAALAETGARVCLIGADLRKPTIAQSLGLVGDVGLTTVLIGKAPIESVLQDAGRNLSVLTSGPVPPNPSELLISAQAREVIRQVAAKFDFTIIDTAPLLPVTDGAEVAAIADATLIVLRSGKTTHDQALRCVEALAKVGELPVGVILNMVTRTRGGFGAEYGYDYVEYRPKEPRVVSPRDPANDGTPQPQSVAPAKNGVRTPAP